MDPHAVCGDKSFLFPPFRDIIERVEKKVNTDRFEVFETLRTLTRQNDLWAKGRACNSGVWTVIDPHAIVTKSQPGASYHAYGIATDMVPKVPTIKSGLQWSWSDYDETKTPAVPIPWEILIKAYVSEGLVAGANWSRFPEQPHCEKSWGFNYSQLYPILTKEGLPAVWKLLMTKVPASANTVNVVAAVPAAAQNPQPPVTQVTPEELDVKTDTQIGAIAKIIRAILIFFGQRNKI